MTRNPAIQLVIFDKDGVLLDLNATWAPVIRAQADHLARISAGGVNADTILNAVGIETGGATPHIRDDGLFAAGSYSDIRDTWQRLCPNLAAYLADSTRSREEMRALSQQAVRGNTVGKGQVQQGLEALRKAGYALAVVTNDNSPSTAINLADLGLGDMFDLVVAADSGHGRKPEPGGILACCAAVGSTPEASVMVGDTRADLEAAHAAGCGHFIAIADSAPMHPPHLPEASMTLGDCGSLVEALCRLPC